MLQEIHLLSQLNRIIMVKHCIYPACNVVYLLHHGVKHDESSWLFNRSNFSLSYSKGAKLRICTLKAVEIHNMCV